MQHACENSLSFLAGAPLSALNVPKMAASALGFSVQDRSLHIVLSLLESDGWVPEHRSASSGMTVSAHFNLDCALSELSQRDNWVLIWARRRANVLCRGTDLYIPARHWVLMRGEHLEIPRPQDFCGSILGFSVDALSPQDRNLFARNAGNECMDSGWGRLLSTYIQGLDAETLHRLGDGASNWSLLELQLMELLRRALLEKEDSARFWNRRDDLDNVQLRGEVLFKRVCAWLTGNYANPDVSSELVANHFNVSSRYIQALFSKYGDGRTFVSYLREKRLQHAHELLVSKKYAHQTIGQISGNLGFTDAVYFGKVFRERFGVTPGQARRQAF